MKGSKMADWEALLIAGKRREAKSKVEKQGYKHLNAEFQRQQGEIRKPSSAIKQKKENNRMGKTRDLFKKLEIPREHFMQRCAQ